MDQRESGFALDPKYDAAGLVTAVITDRASGAVLMVAHMNADALAATRASGRATFWSRSRQALWVKGETSGHVLDVVELRIDCDQDAIWVIAEPRAIVLLPAHRRGRAGAGGLRRTLALALLASACGPAPERGQVAESGGAALERAAIVRGIVEDPARIDPVGAYSSDTDRVCVTPRGEGYRIGASVDYGEEQGCLARGTAEGGQRLRVAFGDDCRFEARVDDRRIAFPPTLPAACDRRFCRGRATLTALIGDRLSGSSTEARAMRAPDDRPLCPD
jgi:phosphoribosyl-AMP cyclohydrolase